MYEELASRTEETTVRACWSQWRSLMGEGWAVDERPARAIIDPEALVVASLALRQVEQRFRDLLLWWARRGAHLLSVQRLQTVAKAFPGSMLEGGVRWFAALAQESGDARWKRLAAGNVGEEPARSEKGPQELRFVEPATLMLRLRAGFGVGAKADLMAFLIGARSSLRNKEVWTTANRISQAIGYSKASVLRSVADMSLARFLEASADRPPMYSLELEPWARVLRLRDPHRQLSAVHELEEDVPFDVPPWRFWAQVYAFLLTCVGWAREASAERVAPVVSASHARDIMEQFGTYLAWNGIGLPDGRALVGEQYLVPFHAALENVVAQVGRDL